MGTVGAEILECLDPNQGYLFDCLEMADYDRDEIRKALLKYCELDTMAMDMIYEGWKDLGGIAEISRKERRKHGN